MLATSKILGFVPMKDSARAKAFYVDVLGLEFAHEDQYAIEVHGGGSRIRIAKTENFDPAPFTILGWEVQNIDQVATTLTDRGVKFETYTWMKQNPLGIWDSPTGARVAWFKDPDGNVLSLSQHPN